VARLQRRPQGGGLRERQEKSGRPLAIPLRTDELASAAGIARSFTKRAPDALRETKLPHNSAAIGAKLNEFGRLGLAD
jgi:hypothetical protein